MASIASRQLLAYQIEATRPLIVGQWTTVITACVGLILVGLSYVGMVTETLHMNLTK